MTPSHVVPVTFKLDVLDRLDAFAGRNGWTRAKAVRYLVDAQLVKEADRR